jgi:hypothetical protein
MNKNKWQSIGTVLGETNIDHFYFSLKNYKAKKGDIITTESKTVPIDCHLFLFIILPYLLRVYFSKI